MQSLNKYPYYLWEDYLNGMYDDSIEDDFQVEKALLLFNDLNRFDYLCSKVILYWEVSCFQNLKNKRMNRVAWLGQAALNIEDRICEINTKKAWKLLDENTKNRLNEISFKNILIYEENCRKIYSGLGKNIFSRHT